MSNAERTGLVKKDVVWCEVGGQEKGEEFYELTEKKKKYLTVCGGIILCAGLMAAITFQFRTEAPEDEAAETVEDAVTENIVDPGENQPEENGESELVVNPENDKTEADDTAPAVDSRPAQTDEAEQSIQPDVEKPEAPSGEVLTDPTVQPDGTPVEDVPETGGDGQFLKPIHRSRRQEIRKAARFISPVLAGWIIRAVEAPVHRQAICTRTAIK